MFDVPELDNIVYMALDRHSVVQCARVDKKWNRLASPYVFQEIPRLPKKQRQEDFRRIVLEDYLQEQNNSPRPPHGPQVALAKYGHCVRRICNLNNILLYLKPSPATKTTKAAKAKKPAKATKAKSSAPEPSADDLLCHFLKRCRNLQQDELSLTKQHFESPQKLSFMHHMSLASIQSLSISSDENSVALTATTLQNILNGVSSSLGSLTLSVPVLHIESTHHAKRQHLSLVGDDDKPGPLADKWIHFQTLKILDIPIYCGTSTSTQVWDWFWTTCSNITTLEVATSSSTACRHLTMAIEHMSRLENLRFGRTDKQNLIELVDHDLAAMITAGGTGWKDVRFKSTAHAGGLAFTALLEFHSSTLEELHFVRHADSAGTVALLATCPNLRVLSALDNKDRPNIRFPEVDAEEFIDWDSEARILRPWPCAGVLETLQIKITGASSPLLRWEERQERVFKRLGRFVNLEVLWLGHEPKLTPVLRKKGHRSAIGSDSAYDDNLYDSEEYDEEEEEIDDAWSKRQRDALPMTWPAGVQNMVNLTKLRELNLSRMDIDFEETVAHWIVQALPSLRTIRGLENREGQVEAFRFLRHNYPKVIRE